MAQSQVIAAEFASCTAASPSKDASWQAALPILARHGHYNRDGKGSEKTVNHFL